MSSADDFLGYASPPCFAHELEFGEYDFAAADRQTAIDVARWRKAERERLIVARLSIPAEERTRIAAEVAGELGRLIEPGPDTIVSLYWPFRGELDLRRWMKEAFGKGARVALPVVVARGQPLVFREWTPDGKLERGVWNIPIPANGGEITPNVVISPLVGYDPNCYRLGYGGGFFDRTLAGLSPRPKVIGVGHPCAAIPTIYPQPHDIPMDLIVTGAGRILGRGE